MLSIEFYSAPPPPPSFHSHMGKTMQKSYSSSKIVYISMCVNRQILYFRIVVCYKFVVRTAIQFSDNFCPKCEREDIIYLVMVLLEIYGFTCFKHVFMYKSSLHSVRLLVVVFLIANELYCVVY